MDGGKIPAKKKWLTPFLNSKAFISRKGAKAQSKPQEYYTNSQSNVYFSVGANLVFARRSGRTQGSPLHIIAF